MQESLQKLICQVQKQFKTSSTGGWCDDGVYSGHVTDGTLATALSNFLAGKTVLGLGDGPGNYRKLLRADGKVRQYDAYDGAPNIVNITGGQVFNLKMFWELWFSIHSELLSHTNHSSFNSFISRLSYRLTSVLVTLKNVDAIAQHSLMQLDVG
jgi:hypothetical protein